MTKESTYINNPLKIGVDGSKLLFQKAPMAALVLAVLSALGAGNYFNESGPAPSEGPVASAATSIDAVAVIFIIFLILLFAFGALVIGSWITGIFAYTSVEIANGREVTFRRAVIATRERLWRFVWLQLLTGLKVAAWALLFIIPGIIMAIRYSLANMSFFDEKKLLTGNAAIKDSLALTKGAWITTFASQTLLNLITLGAISPIVDTGSKALLYRQFNQLQRTDTPKPKAHVLSWVTLWVTILIVIVVTSLMGYALVNYGLSALGL
jgi:hypothetical protein